MTCDCTYEHGIDKSKKCLRKWFRRINRLTKWNACRITVAAVLTCENQRDMGSRSKRTCQSQPGVALWSVFISIVFVRDTFVYKYVGDPVLQGEEGIQRFYFMMLQKEEFIDATTKRICQSQL
ncbi:hypothetical protein JOM56_011462 [Amanita muscaria]